MRTEAKVSLTVFLYYKVVSLTVSKLDLFLFTYKNGICDKVNTTEQFIVSLLFLKLTLQMFIIGETQLKSGLRLYFCLNK